MMKKIWIDYLRIIALIAVIVTHVSAGFLYDVDFNFLSNWWIGLFSTGSMRFCVPVFVMISGALLLPKQYSLKKHIQKRFTRVVIPFLFWSFIYIMIDLTLPILKGEPIILASSLKHIASSLIFGARGHFWYIYMIIGLYLFLPIIQKWVLHYERGEMKLYLVLWAFTLAINLVIPSSPREKGYNFVKGVDLIYFSGFLGYLILGYFLSVKNIFDNRKGKYYSLLLIITGLLITYVGTFLVSKHANEYSRNFIRYLTPNVLLVSAGLFLLIKNNLNKKIKQPQINQGIQMISQFSYGIYLSHAFVLFLLKHLGIHNSFIHPIIGIITTTTLCLVLSFLITLVINKLPYGKYISG